MTSTSHGSRRPGSHSGCCTSTSCASLAMGGRAAGGPCRRAGAPGADPGECRPRRHWRSTASVRAEGPGAASRRRHRAQCGGTAAARRGWRAEPQLQPPLISSAPGYSGGATSVTRSANGSSGPKQAEAGHVVFTGPTRRGQVGGARPRRSDRQTAGLANWSGYGIGGGRTVAVRTRPGGAERAQPTRRGCAMAQAGSPAPAEPPQPQAMPHGRRPAGCDVRDAR